MDNQLEKKIMEYLPVNEQEEADKEVILEFIKTNDNCLLRENKIAHLTASAWIVNAERTKVLMVYHNIYDSWSWCGGHADGVGDLLQVALREAREETGIRRIKPVSDKIYSLETLCVNGHRKNGKYVPSHLHLNITYLLEGDDSEPLSIKPDENSGVKWVDIKVAPKTSSEIWMRDIYEKLNNKLNAFK